MCFSDGWSDESETDTCSISRSEMVVIFNMLVMRK